MACAEREDGFGVVGDGTSNGVCSGWFPLRFGSEASNGGNALAELREAPTRLRVVPIRNRVQIDKGSPHPGREHFAECGLPSASRTDQNHAW
jgi:hypothetical protein